MIKKLGHILTYHDSEPTEIIQGLIWLIFAPIVLEAIFPNYWYVAIISILVGFGTLYAVVYENLKTRKNFGFAYGFMAILFSTIFFGHQGFHTYNAMNWGWIVITISALSNIRRINQKINAKKEVKVKDDVSKMYREELEHKIEQLQKENFDLRFKNIELQDSKK